MLSLSLVLSVGGVATAPWGLEAACPSTYSANRTANSTGDSLALQFDRAGWLPVVVSDVSAATHLVSGVVALISAVFIIILVLVVGGSRASGF